MMNLLAAVGVGFVLGMRHATDPDHVVAVSTIVSRQRSIRQAGWIGALWGVGHTLTIFFVGAGIILFNLVIPPRLGLAMELAVGLMLILLGVLNLTGVTRRISERYAPAHSHAAVGNVVHSHVHEHDGTVHDHVHGHRPEVHMHLDEPVEQSDQAARGWKRLGIYHALRPLAVGLVHGLAGSAAVALLVLAEIREPRWAMAYLLVFGIGTIAGMMLITMAIGAPFAWTRKRFTSFHRGLGVASGVLSVAFGLFIAFHIGITDGLFAAHPHWTPE